jgi:hypothetical protein
MKVQEILKLKYDKENTCRISNRMKHSINDELASTATNGSEHNGGGPHSRKHPHCQIDAFRYQACPQDVQA